MSKVIKQMEMDALQQTFADVRDLVVLSITGLSSQSDHTFRTALRKKNIRLQVIKNSLTRRVFQQLGMAAGGESPYWAGPTALAWGANSIAELSRTIDAELKNAKMAALYKDKVTVKGAVVEGQQITFEQALRMPTRAEAIARVVMLALAPASRLVSQITGPAAQVASQIKQLSEKKGEEAAAPAPAENPPA
jgi:large subunit ribosomal protein L10